MSAQACTSPVFVCRPEAAQHEPPAAPLRIHAALGVDWSLGVRILKRRGPSHEGLVTLPSVPGRQAAVLTPRMRRLGRPAPLDEVAADALGRLAAVSRPRRHDALQ